MDSINSESESKTVQENQHFHVLAVDDSQIDRKLLEKLLTVSSYQVTCVDSGDKALEYLGLLDIEDNEYERSSSLSTSSSNSAQPKVGKINLIMTDYSMPGISGYDLLKRVKDSSWKDIPVVIMSSENVPSTINKCLEGGAEEFLLKPVKLSDLRKLHSQLLNSITNYPNSKEEEEEDEDDEEEETETETVTVTVTEEETLGVNGKNNINSNKRKATSSDIKDRQPRVKELPVS